MIIHREYRVRTNNWIARSSHWGQMPHTRDKNQTQLNRFDSRLKYDYDLYLSTDVRGEENSIGLQPFILPLASLIYNNNNIYIINPIINYTTYMHAGY